VPLPNPTIAGGDNRILAVVQSGIDAGVAINALDPYGNAMGATAVASMSQDWGVIDLGVCRLPTVGYPTLPKISITAGALWASGGAGPNILASPAGLAINEILCLPDKNLALIYERTAGVQSYSRDGFPGAAIPLAGQNDNLGNPWTAAWNNINVASPGQLVEEVGEVTNQAGWLGGGGASSLDGAHLAGILQSDMLIAAKPLFQHDPGVASGGDFRLTKKFASGAYVQARLADNVTSYSLSLAAATNTTLNTLGSRALATLSTNQKYRLALQTQGQTAFVTVSRDDGGPVFIPGSAAYAPVGVTGNAAVAGGGVPGLAIMSGNHLSLWNVIGFSWEVDPLPLAGALLAFDGYTVDGVAVDSYRTSSAGVFAGQKLVSVQRGAFPKLQPSTTSVAVVCAPVDQGAANDLISAVVRVRERFTYGA
jgi:hypothetical protein